MSVAPSTGNASHDRALLKNMQHEVTGSADGATEAILLKKRKNFYSEIATTASGGLAVTDLSKRHWTLYVGSVPLVALLIFYIFAYADPGMTTDPRMFKPQKVKFIISFVSL